MENTTQYKTLLSPYSINELVLKNRILMAPMEIIYVMKMDLFQKDRKDILRLEPKAVALASYLVQWVYHDHVVKQPS